MEKAEAIMIAVPAIAGRRYWCAGKNSLRFAE
jgi:hypothetical protein